MFIVLSAGADVFALVGADVFALAGADAAACGAERAHSVASNPTVLRFQ
jgi:hypothetical protein